MAAVTMLAQMQAQIEEVAETKEKIGEVVKQISQVLRESAVVLAKVFAVGEKSVLDAICAEQLETFEKLKPLFLELKSVVAPGEYFRYHDMFRFSLQKAIHLAAFHVFLKDGTLLQPEDVCHVVGLCQPEFENSGDFLQFDIEDYLMGLLMLGPDLARLAITCVTNGNYALPLKIREFLSDLDSGFRLLNLKNDAIRRKYDSLKYDVRRVEEVVFDLTVRGLIGSERLASQAKGDTGEPTPQ